MTKRVVFYILQVYRKISIKARYQQTEYNNLSNVSKLHSIIFSEKGETD